MTSPLEKAKRWAVGMIGPAWAEVLDSLFFAQAKEARDQERAAVVAYLRANEHAGQYVDFTGPIEKGEHISKPKRKR